MATVHTPPIDLYAETQDLQERSVGDPPTRPETSPRENGERDEQAIEAGVRQLRQLFG